MTRPTDSSGCDSDRSNSSTSCRKATRHPAAGTSASTTTWPSKRCTPGGLGQEALVGEHVGDQGRVVRGDHGAPVVVEEVLPGLASTEGSDLLVEVAVLGDDALEHEAAPQLPRPLIDDRDHVGQHGLIRGQPLRHGQDAADPLCERRPGDQVLVPRPLEGLADRIVGEEHALGDRPVRRRGGRTRPRWNPRTGRAGPAAGQGRVGCRR